MWISIVWCVWLGISFFMDRRAWMISCC
ncbi:hypothetical protein NC652_006381 [Populus alba x Populus x berolinensis]|nr:hypothetical protein NC652_006381 [Populus alba x Populus x berolinensis]